MYDNVAPCSNIATQSFRLSGYAVISLLLRPQVYRMNRFFAFKAIKKTSWKSESLLLEKALKVFQVELEGFEPSSKRGNHTLSTCLFWPSVFVSRQDPDHQSQPYPLKIHQGDEAHHGYFRFTCTAEPSDSEQHPWSGVSFHHLVTE